MEAETERDCTSSLGVRKPAEGPLRVLLFLFCLLAGASISAQPNAKNVVVLSGGRGRASLNQMEASLRSHFRGPVSFSIVDLENPRFEEKSYQESLAEALRSAYSEKPDLVIACMDTSLRFAVQYRDRMFPGVPIVFMSVSTLLVDRQKWPGVTGVAVPPGVKETVDLALRLHPDTTTIAVLTSLSQAMENDYLAAVHSELLHHQDKVKEIDIVGPPSGNMLERVAALPPHTVVLFQLIPHDSEQPAISAFDVLATVTQHFPTYSNFSHLVYEHGGIGGPYYNAAADATLAGEIAARVLSGEPPENIPIVHLTDAQIRVDWRQLQRWHIPESALPPGSMILFREPTFWERYYKYVLAAILVIAAQSLLIAALLWQRARKRKAEMVLRESEERFRRLANTTPSLIWMCDTEGSITYLNDRRISFTGTDPHAGHGDTWMSFVHPDDLPGMRDVLAKALKAQQPFSKEYRLRRTDGVYRWMYEVASPNFNGDGTLAGFIGSAIDTTDQKLARQALEKVSGQLIEAQEKERTRIARELHDDICQRLALLAVALDHANHDGNGSSRSLEDMRKLCGEIADDVQSLSHELHSSRLDYLGIEGAIRIFGDELSRQHGVRVEFKATDVPEHLPPDVSLCLFRVAQEALHNAVKYSQTGDFAAELSGAAHEVRLEVRDWGKGFDLERVKRNGGGLGLVSMQERVNLVQGKLCIDSRPGEGTRVVVLVPLVPEDVSPAHASAPEYT